MPLTSGAETKRTSINSQPDAGTTEHVEIDAAEDRTIQGVVLSMEVGAVDQAASLDIDLWMGGSKPLQDPGPGSSDFDDDTSMVGEFHLTHEADPTNAYAYESDTIHSVEIPGPGVDWSEGETLNVEIVEQASNVSVQALITIYYED